MRLGAPLLALVTLAWAFRNADPKRVGALLSDVGGAALLLVLLPQPLALLAEAAGWRLAFQGMGRRLPLWGLFRTRLASEAVAQTLPLGALLSESLKPVLLARTCGADLATSLAGIAARKWSLVVSQCLYVGLFALLSFGALGAMSGAVLGGPGLGWLVLAAAALLGFLGAALLVVMRRGRLAARAAELLGKVPRLGALLAARQTSFGQADLLLARFFERGRCVRPLLLFFGAWLLEAAETALILSLLGVKLPLLLVGALEVSASFVRNVAWLLPAGVGAQDLSYLVLLRASGVADALELAATFLLLKRAKECFWALVGYAALSFELRAASPARNSSVVGSLLSGATSHARPELGLGARG